MSGFGPDLLQPDLPSMRRTRTLPLLLLVAALAGMAWFSRGLRLVDTVGLLASGVLAGAALAMLAAARGRT